MDATLGVDLLKGPFTVREMTVGNALAIASVREKYNERRVSMMIDEMSGEKGFSSGLTAQERYFILLSHHALSDNDFVENEVTKSPEDYFTSETMLSDIPSYYEAGDIKIGHIYGRHLDILDLIHENGAEWYNGQLACQVIGDLSHVIGGDSVQWDELTIDTPADEIKSKIIERIKFISNLSLSKYQALTNVYNVGLVCLEHLVILGSDNEGMTLIAQRGGKKGKPERFCALDELEGTIKQLAELISPASDDHDESWQHELDGGNEY